MLGVMQLWDFGDMFSSMIVW